VVCCVVEGKIRGEDYRKRSKPQESKKEIRRGNIAGRE
jgi:hypothetical protein